MEKTVLLWFVALGALGSFAASEADRAAARAELVQGVSRIDVGGGALPGGFILLGDDAFSLAECRNYDGTVASAAVGAFYGQGKAVFLGHPAYLTSTDFKCDTKRLLQNAVSWEFRSRATPRIAALRDASIAKLFKSIGYRDVRVVKDASNLSEVDILVLNGVKRDEVEPVLAFVKAGGGLIEGALGWGYMYFNKDACFAEDYADNRLMGAIGTLMGDIGVNRVGTGFPTDSATMPRGTTVEDAIAALLAGEMSDTAVRKQVSKTLSHLMNALPSGVRPDIYTKLLQITSRPEAKVVPTPQRPLGAESIVARLAILARKNAWLSEPEKVWPADPAAASYPGLVKPGTPTIVRDVAVRLGIPKWHSTGVYAAPGGALTVRIPVSATKLGLKVRVGTTQDDLSAANEWKRAPLVTVEIPLVKPETTFASPFGGLVYVVVPTGLKGETSVNLAGGVMAPWFRKGRDTNEKFQRECAETGAPWGEIEGESYVVTSYLAALGKCTDPAWVADYWDEVLSEDLRVSGGGVRAYPERFCSDVQLTVGFLHNGYPLMGHIDASTLVDLAVDKEILSKGGAWGVYHEIGHNHQNGDWTPDGTGEVTCNIFTLLAISEVAGRDYRDRDFVTARRPAALRVRRWVGSGKKFAAFKSDYFLALEFYARLLDAYGFEPFAQTFTAYRQPGFVRPKDDADKWNVFARVFSKTVNANIAEVMTLWNMPITDATREACAAYPKAPASLFKGLAVEPYVPLKTEPVSGDYMGVCLTGERCGAIELYPTRADIPEGERAARWKGDWMLLRRVEAQKTRLGDKGRGREVEFTRPYYIGVYEVTRQQWHNVMGEWKGTVGAAPGPDAFKPANDISNFGARGGVDDGVSWPKMGHKVGGRSFLGRLREITGFRAEFDLPTEAQWEAACRAGQTTTWNNGEDKAPYKEKTAWSNGKEIARDHVLDKLARYYGNGPDSDGPAVVGSYEPNAWGLYDMHGNVWEQCLDYLTWASNTDPNCSGKDPTGIREAKESDDKAKRVICGGSFWHEHFGQPSHCEPSCRSLAPYFPPSAASGAIGMRVCVDGALASVSSSAPWAETLTPAAIEARAAIVREVGVVHPGVLPGQVFVLDGAAFPILAARTWENEPACWGAGAFVGKGRVFYLAIEPSEGDNADLGKLVSNVRRWLKNGAWFGGCREVDGARVRDEEIANLVDYVKGGGGLLVTGRAYPWWLDEMEANGAASVVNWPGNRLLKEFGLMAGRFVVRSESGNGDYFARFGCLLGAAEPQSDAFATQKQDPVAKAVPTPDLASTNPTRVPDGAKIAFLGDSITRLGNDKDAWIDQVVKGLTEAGAKDVTKYPAGWDGQNAGDMAGRVGGILSDPEVKVMTLSCGVNDIWGYDWGRGVELADYKRHVRAIYDKAAAAGVLVVALTPTLVREEPTNDYNRLLEPFAQFVREEATRRGLPLADCRAAELEFLKGFPPDSGKHFSYDGVHPVAAGHEVMAREVLRALRK